MAEITASMVKELRERTDAPMMDCKKALSEADGDMARAEEILRVRFGNKASKAAGRVAAEGTVGVSISADGKVGAGMVVTAVIAGDEMKFLLGSREIASGDIDVYSEKSPLGSAVLGAEIGATVSYTAPNGREIKVEIKAAEFFA